MPCRPSIAETPDISTVRWGIDHSDRQTSLPKLQEGVESTRLGIGKITDVPQLRDETQGSSRQAKSKDETEFDGGRRIAIRLRFERLGEHGQSHLQELWGKRR
jgi:hypothetical protein